MALYCRSLIGRYDRYGGVQFQSSLSLSIEVVLVRIWVLNFICFGCFFGLFLIPRVAASA